MWDSRQMAGNVLLLDLFLDVAFDIYHDTSKLF